MSELLLGFVLGFGSCWLIAVQPLKRWKREWTQWLSEQARFQMLAQQRYSESMRIVNARRKAAREARK